MPRTFFPVTIPGSDGHKISGILGVSKAASNPSGYIVKRPLIILLHGLLNDKFSQTIVGIEREILPFFDTFRFDFSGNGASEGESSYSDYPRQVEDVNYVINFFERNEFCIESFDQPSLEVKLICEPTAFELHSEARFRFDVKVLLGHSKGGSVAMLFAGDDLCKVPYIINISGRNDLREKSLHRFDEDQLKRIQDGEKVLWRTTSNGGNQERPIWVSASDFAWRDNFNPKVFNKIALNRDVKAVLTIHGSEDKVVPLTDALLFDKCFQLDSKHTLEILDGCSHQFLREGEMKNVGLAINTWLLNQNLASEL